MALTEHDVKREERLWAKEKNLLLRKQKIDKERKSLKQKRFTTTKIIMFFLFLNCTLIELFTCWATVQSLQISRVTMMSPDFTPLVTLIGTVVGEVIGFAIYAMKSMRENTANGITYELAMRSVTPDSRENMDDKEAVG